MNLLEAYKKRLSISEKVYSKAHGGENLSDTRKMTTAVLLNNTAKFLNESFSNSVGTQRSDLGEFKKFCLNLVTVAVPNLIANDLVIVHPMTSISGYITYVKYVAGSNKGQTKQGDVFNDPFRLGAVNPNYSSSAVVETFAGDGSTKAFTVMWTPLVKVAKITVNDAEKVAETDFTVAGNTITFTTAPEAEAVIKVAYLYDNVVIPQNDIPVVNAELASIPLVAKARRIAVYYSQIAAFQAKTDYGWDLGDQLAEKSVGQLMYEIDTEVTNLLIDNAAESEALKFNKTVPYGVSMAQHYESFAEKIEIGKQLVYDKTKRYAPTYMLLASNVLPIITFLRGFKASDTSKINGPYFAGTLNGLKLFVTPNIAPGKYVLGVNGDDMMSSAAVYAPYMPVIPTQLLGYADGGMSQGFSTMYALELLNKDLLVAGSVVTEDRVVVTKQSA